MFRGPIFFPPEDSKVKAEIDKYKLAAEENKDGNGETPDERGGVFSKGALTPILSKSRQQQQGVTSTWNHL